MSNLPKPQWEEEADEEKYRHEIDENEYSDDGDDEPADFFRSNEQTRRADPLVVENQLRSLSEDVAYVSIDENLPTVPIPKCYSLDQSEQGLMNQLKSLLIATKYGDEWSDWNIPAAAESIPLDQINRKDDLHSTPFQHALEANRVDLARLLRDKLHAASTRQSLVSTLASVCRKGYLEAAMYLIRECLVDPDSRTFDKRTALLHAASSENVELVRFLVDNCGCNPLVYDEGLNSVLHLCVNRDVAQFFVEECNVNVNRQNYSNEIPLMTAVSELHYDVIPFFVNDCGCSLNYPEKLSDLQYNNDDEDDEEIKELGPRTLFEIASWVEPMLRFLVENFDLDLNLPDATGKSILDRCIVDSNITVLRYLQGELGLDVIEKALALPDEKSRLNKTEIKLGWERYSKSTLVMPPQNHQFGAFEFYKNVSNFAIFSRSSDSKFFEEIFRYGTSLEGDAFLRIEFEADEFLTGIVGFSISPLKPESEKLSDLSLITNKREYHPFSFESNPSSEPREVMADMLVPHRDNGRWFSRECGPDRIITGIRIYHGTSFITLDSMLTEDAPCSLTYNS